MHTGFQAGLRHLTSWFSRPPRWRRDPLRVGRKLTPRTVLVTGATGFVGQHLCRWLIAQGDHIIVLTRDHARAWDLYGPHAWIVTRLDDLPSTLRIHAVVNLAGASIASKPWTALWRAELLESRLRVTNDVTALIARLGHKPRVLINASAVGYYGVRGDEEITEAVRGQPIFQSHLCQTWELAAQGAEKYGVRVCRLRFGVVLGADGGMLPGLVRPARFRMRIVLGSGRQWVSWIHIRDLVDLIGYCMVHDDLSGGINATAVHPVRQKHLARTLAARFGRSLSVPVPAWLLRAVLGELSQLLVDGQRVVPTKALCRGFKFRYRDVSAALEQLLPRDETGRELITAPVQIIYDSDCPACELGKQVYCTKAQREGLQWRFDHVADRPDLLQNYGLDTQTARKRVYVLDDEGRMVSGMSGIVLIWAALPRWRVVARIARLPLISGFMNALYDLVIAPLFWRWSLARRRNPQSS